MPEIAASTRGASNDTTPCSSSRSKIGTHARKMTATDRQLYRAQSLPEALDARISSHHVGSLLVWALRRCCSTLPPGRTIPARASTPTLFQDGAFLAPILQIIQLARTNERPGATACHVYEGVEPTTIAVLPGRSLLNASVFFVFGPGYGRTNVVSIKDRRARPRLC